MRVLNLYAGLGGNRKLWSGCRVTAVEANEEIAAIYRRLYPSDTVLIGDAHEYLRLHYHMYDFIWSSPPCQKNTKMVKATRHKERHYPDLRMYEEIIFLRHFHEGKWVVENVDPYYQPLIPPTRKVGRHLFWSNFIFNCNDVERPGGFINMTNQKGKDALQDWLGIHYEGNVYYNGNHCPAQVLRNCVHPEIGLQIFDAAMGVETSQQSLELC